MELYQIIEFAVENDMRSVQDRAENLLKMAKAPTELAQAHKLVLSRFSVLEILDAASDRLLPRGDQMSIVTSDPVEVTMDDVVTSPSSGGELHG